MQQHAILIVEDEEPILRALSDKLAQKGFEVIQARTGQEGLAVALEKHPAMILLDIIMPVMDGITMLQELRKNAWGATVPVIMLTNLTDGDRTQQSIQSGAFDYLIKAEWNIDDLIKRVMSYLPTS